MEWAKALRPGTSWNRVPHELYQTFCLYRTSSSSLSLSLCLVVKVCLHFDWYNRALPKHPTDNRRLNTLPRKFPLYPVIVNCSCHKNQFERDRETAREREGGRAKPFYDFSIKQIARNSFKIVCRNGTWHAFAMVWHGMVSNGMVCGMVCGGIMVWHYGMCCSMRAVLCIVFNLQQILSHCVADLNSIKNLIATYWRCSRVVALDRSPTRASNEVQRI